MRQHALSNSEWISDRIVKPVDLCKALFLAAALSLFSLAAAGKANAATIRYIYSEPNGNLMSDARIEIIGEIRPNDSKALPALLKKSIDNSRTKAEGRPSFYWQPCVIIDSLGGDLKEAMKIGRLLREARATVMITPGASCASACVVAFAGGVDRFWFGDRHHTGIGIHRMRFTDPSYITLAPANALRAYNQVKREVGLYLEEMGIAKSLHEHMFSVGSQKIEWLSRDQANNYSLLGEDPAYAEWFRANLINEKGADWVHRNDAFIACLNRNYPNESVDACKAETGHETGDRP